MVKKGVHKIWKEEQNCPFVLTAIAMTVTLPATRSHHLLSAHPDEAKHCRKPYLIYYSKSLNPQKNIY